LRIQSFAFVGAASSRDRVIFAAGSRSYNEQMVIKSKDPNLNEYTKILHTSLAFVAEIRCRVERRFGALTGVG